MELEVYWTTFAIDKLNLINDYYQLKAGEKIARTLIRGIINESIKLEKNPRIGQKEELLIERPEEFRYLIYKKYKIIYVINSTKHRIDIVNVFDTRQNPVNIKSDIK